MYILLILGILILQQSLWEEEWHISNWYSSLIYVRMFIAACHISCSSEGHRFI